MKTSLIFFLLLLPVAATLGAEEILRCKSKLIQAGEKAGIVLKHCGEPDSKTVEIRPVFSGNRRTGTYEVEIWRYERGVQFPAVLEVEAGELKSIEYIK